MLKKRCEQCGGEYAARKNARFCSRECYHRWKRSRKVIKVCEMCGKEYDVIPARKDRSRFCSRECKYKWYSENMCGENHPSWKCGGVIKTCEQCGRKHVKELNQINRSHHHFCSRECHNKWMSENQCGRSHHQWKPKVKKKCEQCGIEFEVKPSESDIRFCSIKCKGKWLSGENSPTWKNGISFEPYCHKFNESFKESIREKFGRVCFLCPTTEEENGRKLCVHHTNYNKDCLCDGSDCEFVPLCAACHTKTNFNRDYWESIIMEKLGAIS